jgi:hypothetical protein
LTRPSYHAASSFSKLFLVAVSAGGAFLLVEVGLRIVEVSSTPSSASSLGFLACHQLVPTARLSTRATSTDTVGPNSIGMRDRERTPEKGPARRILPWDSLRQGHGVT